MSSEEDVAEDIEKLYNALREHRMNTATIWHTHLRKAHKLTQKSIRESVKTLGLKKTVQIAAQDTKPSKQRRKQK